jgi:hypothetical protein
MKKIAVTLASLVLLLAAEQRAHATFFDVVTGAALNVENNDRDISTERIVLQNPNSGLTNGDIVYGYIQLGKQTSPNGTSFLNPNPTTYVVFSEQISMINASGTAFNLVPVGTVATTINTAPYLLSALAGTRVSDNSTAIAALFSSVNNAGIGPDLTSTAPAGVTTMDGMVNYIKTNFMRELTIGIGQATDFLSASMFGGFVTSNLTKNLLDTTSGPQFAQFQGGLSVLENLSPFLYAKVEKDALGNLHQLTINGGNASFDSLSQIYNVFSKGVNDNASSGGFEDGASFLFTPQPSPVPEPASAVLMVLGAFGMGIGAYRSNRKANKASAV